MACTLPMAANQLACLRQIGRKIETPADWMEARMEYAKIDPEMEALKEVTYDRGDWIKVVLVVVGSFVLGRVADNNGR